MKKNDEDSHDPFDPGQAPLDVLGCAMQENEWGLVLAFCKQHVKRMSPEYCLYLLSSSTVYGLGDSGAQIELYALMMPKLNKLNSLRVRARSKESQKREAVWRSALTSVCPAIFDQGYTPEQSPAYKSLLHTFCQMTSQHGATITLLDIDLESGQCSYGWPATSTATVWVEHLMVVVKLDPLHLVRSYASFCERSQTQSTYYAV